MLSTGGEGLSGVSLSEGEREGKGNDKRGKEKKEKGQKGREENILEINTSLWHWFKSIRAVVSTHRGSRNSSRSGLLMTMTMMKMTHI